MQLEQEKVQQLFRAAREGGNPFAQQEKLPLLVRWARNYSDAQLEKSLGRQLRSVANDATMEAEEQGAVVNETAAILRLLESSQGVKEKTTTSFAFLRACRDRVEPANAIITTLAGQVASFSRPVNMSKGFVEEPGFNIRLTRKDATATTKDLENMHQLTMCLTECGFVAPPIDERPVGWQPGFMHFLQSFVEDSLTLDWSAVRFWKSKNDPDKFPVVSFASVDSARIRYKARKNLGLKNGIVRTADPDTQRETTKEAIAYVKVNSPGIGGLPEEEYTEDEISVMVRNPRQNEEANGYGCSELERSVDAITGWLYARDYNLSRFRTDTLPRGIMTVLGNISQQQFQMFRLEWKQMLEGAAKRWKIPILKANPQAGSAVNWLPLDQSSREMEYHQMMFSVALWLHANFGVHPEETGYDALTPFRPPLSEGSPEAKLQYSQSKGLNRILRHVEDWINRAIVWRIFPDKQYTFEFVGKGQFDHAQQIELWGQELAMGLNTPGNIWALRDIPRPASIADHPFWELPAPPMQGMQYVDAMMQAEQQAQMAQGQQQMAQSQMQQQSAMQQAQMGQGGPQGAQSDLPDTHVDPSETNETPISAQQGLAKSVRRPIRQLIVITRGKR